MEDQESLPVSSFFEENGNGNERTEEKREEKSKDFPVFDAVPF